MSQEEQNNSGNVPVTETKESPTSGDETFNINIIRNKIAEVRNVGRKITREEILEIRGLLNKVNGIVINFDDTITQPPENPTDNPYRKRDNFSIRAICREVQNLGQTNFAFSANSENAIAFIKFLNQEPILDTKLLEQVRKSPVKFFYGTVLRDLPKPVLDDIYDTVVDNQEPTEAVLLNPNFIDAVKIVSEKLGSPKLSLFVLSLNTPELMQKWYKKHMPSIADQLSAHDIALELIDTMGNQIIYDSQGNVTGIIDHVENTNKKNYIPQGMPMFADMRETAGRAEDGVNVLNIEGKMYDVPLAKETANFYRFLRIIAENRATIGGEVIEIENVLVELAEALKRQKICFEMMEVPIKKRNLDFLGKRGDDVTNKLLESELEVYRAETKRLVDLIQYKFKQTEGGKL